MNFYTASMCAIAAALISQPTMAQTTQTDTDEVAVLKTVQVTARRSSENIEDVPVVMTALSNEALEAQGIKSENDLQIAVPGLTVRSAISSNQINYALRGQTVDAFSNSAPAITAYLNEVPVGGTSGTALFDMQSIQVLKGPQGTLFGRNATGGAVLYETRKPGDEYGGYIKGTYGEFQNAELEGAFDLPINDMFALRLAGRIHKRDGFQNNIMTGEDYNSIDAQVARATLSFEHDGIGLTNITVGQIGNYGGTNGALSIQSINGLNGPTTYVDPITGNTETQNQLLLQTHLDDAFGPGLGASTDPLVNSFFSGLPDFWDKRQSGQAGGFHDVATNRSQEHDAEQVYFANTTTFEINDNLTLKNIFGYNRVISEDQLDTDGSPYEFFHAGNANPIPFNRWGEGFTGDAYVFANRQWSEEIQLSGEFGNIKFITGAFISEEEIWLYAPVTILSDLGSPYLGAFDNTVKNESQAVFGQLTYAVTDRLNLTGGIRQTWEDVSIDYGLGLDPSDPTVDPRILGPASAGGIPTPTSQSEDNPSWLLGVDFRVNDDLLLFFNHRGSWRTPGYNGNAVAFDANGAPVANDFAAEKTYDFEIGAKYTGLLGSIPTIINLAIYDQVVEDAQRSLYFASTANSASIEEAQITGLEFDSTFAVTDWLTLGGSYTYTDARYTGPLGTAVGQTFFFGPHADSPEHQISLFFQTSNDLGELGTLNVRGQFYDQSEFYYSNNNRTVLAGTEIDGYSLVKLRAELQDIYGSNVTAAIYADNLFDEEYSLGGLPMGAVHGANATIPGAPRMVGAELKFEF